MAWSASVNRRQASAQSGDHSLQRLAWRLVSRWADAFDSRVPDGPRLILGNPDGPAPDSILPDKPGVELVTSVSDGDADLIWEDEVVARTSADSLPFQTASLTTVLLCHVIDKGGDKGDDESGANGGQAILVEACRTLQPGGFLLILGLNRLGLWRLARGTGVGLPAISPLTLRTRLEALDMTLITTLAAGFLRGERPRDLNRGLARALIPVADLLLVVARPAEPRIMNPLAKSKARAVGTGVPSALAGR